MREKNGARLPDMYLSWVHKRFLVPVNGSRAICLPSKQAEIELEVVRLISGINLAAKRGKKVKEIERERERE